MLLRHGLFRRMVASSSCFHAIASSILRTGTRKRAKFLVDSASAPSSIRVVTAAPASESLGIHTVNYTLRLVSSVHRHLKAAWTIVHIINHCFSRAESNIVSNRLPCHATSVKEVRAQGSSTGGSFACVQSQNENASTLTWRFRRGYTS